MKLLCLVCGNYTYFETDITTVKEITTNDGHIIIDNALFPDFDYTEDTLRDNLRDIVDYVLKQDDSSLTFDPETETYYNRHIICARCGSQKVTNPIPKPVPCNLSLEEELDKNREEFNYLRKERKHNENNLPVLRQQ